MSEHNNIATHAITNSATGLNMRDLFGDDLLLNSEDEKDNGGTNKGNNDVLSEEELVRTRTNFQPDTHDLPIPINLNLDSTLPNPYLTTTQPVLRRPEPNKARPNANKKPDTGSHIPAFNDLDLSIQTPANNNSTCKRGPKDVFTSLELVNKASEK